MGIPALNDLNTIEHYPWMNDFQNAVSTFPVSPEFTGVGLNRVLEDFEKHQVSLTKGSRLNLWVVLVSS